MALSFLLVAVLLVSAALTNEFYFEKISLRQAKNLSLSNHDANAIKHAYAASLVYSSLRKVWFSKEFAKESTIFLGKINEIAETIFKPKGDSSLEMMKDMANNMMGICVAQWLDEHHQSIKNNRLSLIGQMAQQDVLIIYRENLDLDKTQKHKAKRSFNYVMANDWFDENRGQFKQRAEMFLASK